MRITWSIVHLLALVLLLGVNAFGVFRVLGIDDDTLLGFFMRVRPISEIGAALAPEVIGSWRLASRRSRIASRVSSSPLKPP